MKATLQFVFDSFCVLFPDTSMYLIPLVFLAIVLFIRLIKEIRSL